MSLETSLKTETKYQGFITGSTP